MDTVKKGSMGAGVLALQKALATAIGFKEKQDGIFGEKTKAAVLQFQKQSGLKQDGIVGKNTWAALTRYLGGNATEPFTAHFKMSEFKCRDGTAVPLKYWSNLQRLMEILEKIRAACGNRPVIIYSGYRTQSYNQKVGGAKASRHLVADAADIAVAGLSPYKVYSIADGIVGSRGGVGRYKTFTHIDCRGYKARW